MKIYTKTGDDGSTGIVSGKRIAKHSSVIEAYGTADELNSFVGWARAAGRSKIDSQLEQIQNDLHVLAADLATPPELTPKLGRFSKERASRLESWIDEMEKSLEPLRQFLLPGGAELASRLHICRTVARRAERELYRLKQEQEVNEETGIYLNRLSDYLFVAARFANHSENIKDVLWDQSR